METLREIGMKNTGWDLGKGFSKLDPQGHQGNTDTWLTPLRIIRALGEFHLDPCGFEGHKTAKTVWTLPDRDGLLIPWFGRVWMNPPYGRAVWDWMSKMEQHRDGIALLFARTDTRWFQDARPDAVMFLRGRIKFLKPDFTESTNAGHGSMLLAYGRANVASLYSSGLVGKIVT